MAQQHTIITVSTPFVDGYDTKYMPQSNQSQTGYLRGWDRYEIKNSSQQLLGTVELTRCSKT
jgi:hypothetical protein